MVGAANFKCLPALFQYLETDLDLDISSLGAAVGLQGVCHVAAVCCFGYITTFISSRMQLLAACAALWSIGTVATATAVSSWDLQISRVIIGLSSGVVGPVSQCLVTEWVKPSQRGKAFGCAVALDSLGQTLAASGIGWLSWKLQSWRPCLLLVATVTAAFSGFSFLTAIHEKRQRPLPYISFLLQISKVFEIRSTRIVILQGFFASTQVQATMFIDMWLQQCGYDAASASYLYSAMIIGNLLSCLFAGWVSDAVAQRYPKYGRIIFGQIGDSLRLPCLYFLLLVAPILNTPLTFSCCLLYGLTQSLNYVGAIKPLCAEAVPPPLVGSTIAIAATVDGAFASIAGAPLVGWSAKHIFGFWEGHSPQQNQEALARAVGYLLAAGTGGALLCNTCLYWTYPSDREAASAWLPSEDVGKRMSDESSL